VTTNVFDKAKNVLASDSRWSYELKSDGSPAPIAVAYVDDTGYDKIAYDIDTGYLFAGDGLLIDKWRTWALSDIQVMLQRPPVTDGFAICMTDLETGDVIYEHGQQVIDTYCRMAGTGYRGAYECWVKNGDAKKAVVSAAKKDYFSGGEVKFLNGFDRKNNLSFASSFSSIKDQFLVKGMVMYTTPFQSPIPLEQAAAKDTRIADLIQNVKMGALSAGAPSGYDPVVWTPSDVARLDEALENRAKRRAARAN
jgi:hypothetical protein